MSIAQPTTRRTAALLLAGALTLAGLFLTRLYNYLLFHSLAELFSVVVAVGVFMLAWNSRRYLDNNYLLFIGVGYLFVANLDLLHTLAYEGMGVFREPGSDLATQLWLAARFTQALTLLIAPVFVTRKFRSSSVWLGFSLLTMLFLSSILVWDIFPVAYAEGQGLTPFKKVSEYFISAGLIAATVLLFRHRKAFDRQVLRLLALSFIVTASSELIFTLYVGVTDTFNLIGHLLKIVAVYALYRAIVETGLIRPYSLLFRNLQRAEERYRHLFDEAPVMYVTLAHRAQGAVITDCNDLFAETLGYDKAEIIGQPLAAFYTDASQAQLVDGREHAPGEEPDSRERQLMTRSGEVIHTLVQLNAESSPSGEEDTRAAYVDVTARRRAEQAEREQRLLSTALTDITAALNSTLELDAVLDRILSHLGDVVPHDSANIMLLEGETAVIARHHGYGPSAEPHLENLHFEISETPILARIVETQEPVVIVDTRTEPDWVEVPNIPWIRSYAAVPICHEEKVIGFINVDSREPNAFSSRDALRLLAFATSATTAIRNAQLYQQAHEARLRAEKADQLKLRFLAMVSHELRTPLTSIQGFATTLLAPDVDWTASDQRIFLDTISSEADRLGELIDQLLDLSRIESGRLSIDPQPQTLQTVLNESRTRLAMLATEHELNISLPDDLPPVFVDTRRVLQVLTNLVGNATKYAPPGTRIAVSAVKNGSQVVVKVSDQGPGIPPEERESVFEAFTRLKSPDSDAADGSGLGLAICKGIVEAHGGRIWVEETSHAGATMAFTLPLA